MRQLLLDLLPETPPSLDNFVPGGNAEALAALSGWLTGQGRESCFLLWGETGSGKSHLLLASGFSYHDAHVTPDLERCLETPENLAVDHVDALSASGQIALFNAFNRIQAANGRLLVAACQAPAHLSLREDLRTRLGSGLLYALHPLSDAQKAAAICRQARARAMNFPQEAVDYLLRHTSRDMRTLSALVTALDIYALEHKRPITLPLLREVLALSLKS
jgi:DnaA family protein